MELQQAEQGSQLEPRRRRKAEPPPIPQRREVVDPAAIAEQNRRAEIGRWAQMATAMDHELVQSLRKSGQGAEEAIEFIRKMEVLAFGRIIDNESIGQVSQGVVRKLVLEGDPPVTAFEKPQSGESFYRVDAEKNEAFRVSRTWNPEKQVFELVDHPLDEEQEEKFSDEERAEWRKDIEDLIKRRAQNIVDIAAYYGISPDELPVNYAIAAPDQGLALDQGVWREYGVSRINELVNFDVIPLTVLRAKDDNHDISAVLDGVVESDPDQKLRTFDQNLYEELMEQGPSHPAAKSLMRMACMDYLTKSLDRGPKNIFYDPANHQFKGIDNARSFPMSAQSATGNKIRFDRYVSLPMQIAQEHAGWQLDDEARKNLKELYDRTVGYALKKKENRGKDLEAAIENIFYESKNDPHDRELNYILKLFGMMFGNGKIAGKEAVEFFQRLNYLVAHGHPPQFTLGKELGNAVPKDYKKKREIEKSADKPN